MEWNDIPQLFIAGAFPWISELKTLDIHFEQPGIKTSSIFNFFASLFAVGLFTYSNYANAYQLIQLPSWWVFLLIGAVLTIVYYTIYTYYRAGVNEGKYTGIVILNFVIYILIFCCLTSSFGLLKIYKDYVVVTGKVYGSDEKAAPSEFEIKYAGNKQMKFKTDTRGHYTILLKREELNQVEAITTQSETGESFLVYTYGEMSVFNYLERVTLKKQ